MTHTPVLLEETINALNVRAGKKYIDATFGEGGHAREILARGGKVLGIELDERQYQRSTPIKTSLSGSKIKNLRLVRGNFKDIETIAKENGFGEVEGVLFDLGLSMRQIRESGRGFSYERPDEPLDMRIDKSLARTAADILNHSSADELYEILARNAEEINSRTIADALCRSRLMKKIAAVGDLLTFINQLPGLAGNRSGIIRRVFQALRIEVNREFENLKKGLEGARRILSARGRIVVISFHPLEDRIVKRFARVQKLTLLAKKPITAPGERSFERSAKLRALGFN